VAGEEGSGGGDVRPLSMAVGTLDCEEGIQAGEEEVKVV
jgi:hypothetical protein